MRVVEAPHEYTNDLPTIFLAGSIEMGKAEDWQTKVINEFKDEDVQFLNPRRKDWDSSWEQKMSNPQFFEQVNWELDGLDSCDIIFMNFDPDTQSPITLLELGLYLNSRTEMVVCCPEGFWRKGNVDIACMRSGVPCFSDFNVSVIYLKKLLGETGGKIIDSREDI